MKNFHPDLLDLDACIYFSTLLLFKKSPLIKQLKFWLDGPKWEFNFIFCPTIWFRFTPLTLTIVIIMDNRKHVPKIKPPAQGGTLNITIAACPAFCCILLQLGGIVLFFKFLGKLCCTESLYNTMGCVFHRGEYLSILAVFLAFSWIAMKTSNSKLTVSIFIYHVFTEFPLYWEYFAVELNCVFYIVHSKNASFIALAHVCMYEWINLMGLVMKTQ